MSDVNKRIYAALVKRDSIEKNISLDKVIHVNDQLIHLVHDLKTEIDEIASQLHLSQTKISLYERRFQELNILIKKKDDIINSLTTK